MPDIENQRFPVIRHGHALNLAVWQMTPDERRELAARLRGQGEAMLAHADELAKESRNPLPGCADLHALAGGRTDG